MTIFGKSDFWSDQGCRASSIQYGGQTTMSQQMAPTFFLHSDDVLTGYQVKPSILGSVHST